MANRVIKIDHPHIVTDKNICNDSPTIAGTRTPVRSIVSYYNDGLSPEEIASKLSYLKLSEIYDALAFFYDNKELIDKEIEENSNEIYWETQVLRDEG